ncbi:MAG: hypothetical protein FWC50_09095 [Planctomycetaceae bacterium]|nr:hypothetical protein [Planctomycetaceae bacterium]
MQTLHRRAFAQGRKLPPIPATVYHEAFFLSLAPGALSAIARRQTVTQWFRAVQISDNFQKAFYHILNIGCNGASRTGRQVTPLRPPR